MLLFDYIFLEHCVIQANRWAGSVFGTTVGSPVNFKEEMPAPTVTLIKEDRGYVCTKCGKKCKVVNT